MYLAYNCKIIIADIYNYISRRALCYNLLNCPRLFFYSCRNSVIVFACIAQKLLQRENKKGNRTFDFPVRYFKRRSSNVNRFFPLQFIISRAFLLPSSLWRGSRFSIKQTSRTNKVPIFYHPPILSRSSPFLLTRLLSKLSLIFQERN